MNAPINETLTANGTVGPIDHTGGSMLVQATGTFGGGTLTVQLNLGAGPTDEYQMTAPESRIFDFPPGARVSIVLTGASSPNLNISVR